MMTKIFTNVFALLYIVACGLVNADVPEKFVGTWELELETATGFPWWDHIRYPVKLVVRSESAVFEDQTGFSCVPRAFFFDEELDAIVFKHCLPEKSDLAFSPFYRVMYVNDRLEGEVWTHKMLFRLLSQCKNQVQGQR